MTTEARSFAAPSANAPLAPWKFQRRAVGDNDVRIDIAYCGICHSDLHQVKDEWGAGIFPMVPGHEIVGRVAGVGRKVNKFKVGELAGVGCLVDTCRKCDNCRKGLEQHCLNRSTFTYNSFEQDEKTPTYGGYSTHIVVHQDFALAIGGKQPLEAVAPLLCAGITTYSPLKRHGIKKGSRVAVLGLGGLGHMAVKIAAAMGAEVAVLSGTAAKKIDAKRLGAHSFELTTDPAAAAKLAGRFDLIVDTVSGPHDLGLLIGSLRTAGTLVVVGASPKPLEIEAFGLIGGRRSIEGSLIGGLAETQEMLDFCAKRKIASDVEVIAPAEINNAYDRLLKSDVRYRFSIDMSRL